MAHRRRNGQKRPPGTLIGEFAGASESEIAARPESSELGSRHQARVLIAALALGLVGVLVGAAFMFEEQSLALYELVEAEVRAWLPEAEEEEAAPAPAPEPEPEPPPPDLPPDLPPEPDEPFAFGETEIKGKADADAVEEAFVSKRDDLAACGEKAKKDGKPHVGVLELAIDVKWNGRQRKVSDAVKDGELDRSLRRCVTGHVKRIKWPRPRDGGKLTITRTLVFR